MMEEKEDKGMDIQEVDKDGGGKSGGVWSYTFVIWSTSEEFAHM